MSTDVNARYFRSMHALKMFMDQNNIQSSDVAGIVDGPDGPGLLYNAGTVDTVGPTIKVTDLDGQTVDAGTDIRIYVQVVENSGVAALDEDDLSASGVVLYYRTTGTSSWYGVVPRWQSPTMFIGTIDAGIVVSPGVDYYVVARDGNGNETYFGTDSAPKQITV